jgi:hypothetical protein
MNIKPLAVAACALLALRLVFAPSVSHGQAAAEDPLLAPLILELTKQQLQVAANQAKIDEKLAAIAEDVRLARIFVGRGGGAPAATK